MTTTKVKYLDDRIARKMIYRTDPAPRSGRTLSGYGRRIPTTRKTWYNGRWYRVYAICYSNAASHYITANGEKLFIR